MRPVVPFSFVAGAIAPPSGPYGVVDCRAWYRSGVGITDVGGKASVWADQSGNGYDLSQGTAASRPTITTADANFNGHDVLTFDGSDDFMQTSAFSGGTYAQPTTIYIVCRFTAAPAFGYVFDSASGTRQALLFGGSSEWYQYAGGGYTSGTAATGTTYVLALVFNGASSAVYANQYSTSAASGNAGSMGLHSLTLGANYDTSATKLNGKVAELLAYSGAHDATVRQSVMTQLGTLYGVTVTA